MEDLNLLKFRKTASSFESKVENEYIYIYILIIQNIECTDLNKKYEEADINIQVY